MVQILAHLALTENPLRHRFHTVWLIYEAAADGITYGLTGSCGLPAGSAAAPAVLASAADWPWPMKDAAGLGIMIEVDDVALLVAGARWGPYEEPPDKPLV
jgi:hypothetical protein